MSDDDKPEAITDEQSFELAKLYFAAAKEAADNLDARLFWSVAGVAVVSGFAAKEFIEPASAAHVWLLLLGWGLLLLAVLALLVGYLLLPDIHFRSARYWLYGDESERQANTCPQAIISVLNVVATLGVIAGAVCVMIYVGLNL